MKQYLGDGVYAETMRNSNMIKLTTEDGVNDEQSIIYIEPSVMRELVRFYEKHIAELS